MKNFKVKCKLVEKRFNLLLMRTSQWKKVDNFQRNARGGHFIFKHEAKFSPREAYLPVKISCKFGEANWCSLPLRALTAKISVSGGCGSGGCSIANAKPIIHSITL